MQYMEYASFLHISYSVSEWEIKILSEKFEKSGYSSHYTLFKVLKMLLVKSNWNKFTSIWMKYSALNQSKPPIKKSTKLLLIWMIFKLRHQSASQTLKKNW